MRKYRAFTYILLTAILNAPEAHGQQRGTFIAPTLLDVLPSSLTPHALALGDRVLKPGKERITIVSELVTDRGERRQLRVILQLPSMVRIEELKGKNATSFDGTKSTGATSRLDEQLLETFSSDTAEAMLASTREGGAVQLLGRRVQSARGNSGPLHDVYEWSGPIRSNPASPYRLKRYAFDADTGLLASTEYVDDSFSPPVSVRILFSDWKKLDASAYPGRIERVENGFSVFTWTAGEIGVGGQQ
jgi:hypothetical protein